jgi:HAD superfamily hydrolase (TIGR01509 family)
MFNALNGLKSLSDKGVKLSVVTSKSPVRTSAILSNLFSDIVFDAVITPEQVSEGRGKPSPDPLLLACIKVGVEPSASVYIGDMEVDRLAAKAAGMNFIHANWGYGAITTYGDVWFDTFDDAIKFLVDTHD